MFFLLFGFVWTMVPLVCLFAVLANGEQVDSTLFIILPIFFIVGCVFMFFGIKSVIHERKLKKLAKTGMEGIGTYIYHASNVTVNDNPLYYIEFFYTNSKGQRVEVKTPSKYHPEEAYYYSKVQTFRIKFDDTDAVIVQPVDHKIASQMRLEMFGNVVNNYSNKTYPTPPQQRPASYVCNYCGNIQDKPDKCSCCGSSRLKKKDH